MRGCFAAVVVAGLLLLPACPGAAATSRDMPAPASPPPAQASNLTVGWHPFTLPYTPLHVVYDRTRDRILVSASSGAQYRLLVLDSSGAILGDWPWPYEWLLLDPASGYAYTWSFSYPGAHVTGIDPSTGTSAADWYESALSGPRFVGGIANHTLYAESDVFLDSRIVGFNVTTGNVVWDYTGLPEGGVGNLAVDPAGRWLFVHFYNYTVEVSMVVNRSSGAYSVLGPAGIFAFSADARRLYLCTSWGPVVLRSYRMGDWTLDSEGVCDGNPLVANPLNEELATAGSGLFILNGTVAGSFPHLADPAWIRGGRTILGMQDGAVGTWDGLASVNVTRRLLNPSLGDEPLSFQSVGGINGSSLQIAVDGASVPVVLQTPYPSLVYVGLAGVPDGNHTLRVTGRDLVGQDFQGEGYLETDATPPRLTVTSPLEATRVPYVLRGNVSDPHLSWVRVNGQGALESQTTWSASLDLRIGDTALWVEAGDALSNRANLSLVVRYWPLHEDNLTNAEDHIGLSVPPDWVGEANASLPGVRISLLLVGPAEPPFAASFLVEALNGTGAGNSFDYALQVADERESVLKTLGAEIVHEPALDSVDGQPAVTFEAVVYLGSVATHYVVTIVPSEAWSRTYVLTMGVPETLWAAYRGTLAWILEGVRIQVAPAAAAPPPPPEFNWGLLAGAAIIGGASGVSAAYLLWRRRSTRRPSEETEDPRRD